ncbi:MAG: PQQ-like beta-propeller repeat protein [Acidobacteriia bacterium]|nr:PQQ-like beta-propeller repeat protein [Terriglobia bacterium]
MLARILFTGLVLTSLALAEDWPEWRGAGRTGVWNETGILDRFPQTGLKIRWRAPLHSGYSGPAVSQGRVFVLDFERRDVNHGTERALAFEEKTGRLLWTRSWEADYTGLMGSYSIGPRATPTVDGDRVYALGAKGNLVCLNAKSGSIVWSRDFVREYKSNVPVWGTVGSPLVDANLVIAVVGGENNAKVVAFDKVTGTEVWRALDANSEPGYASPVIITAGGKRQLIIWHATALVSLNPANGELYWQQPFNAQMGLAVATPVHSGGYLLISSFYTGSMMMELDSSTPSARMLWKGKSVSEIQTDGLHTLINTPVMDGGYVYGIDSYGQLRCLNAKTGERVWESLALTQEKARWSTGLMVRHRDRYFINNDRGDLIIARFTPKGYEEISRAKLIKPTSTAGIGRRELGAVNWSHPAYAGRHIFARNDEELLCASLEQ